MKCWGAGTTAHKRTEITVETHQVLIVRGSRSMRGWCAECGREVDLVRVGDVGGVIAMPGPMTRANAGAQAWHFCEGPDGTNLVCVESLQNSI